MFIELRGEKITSQPSFDREEERVDRNLVVPGAGVEPARRVKLRGILSPLRLPISPPGLGWFTS